MTFPPTINPLGTPNAPNASTRDELKTVAADVLAHLKAQGVTVTGEWAQGQYRLRATPSDALTQPVRDTITQYRPILLWRVATTPETPARTRSDVLGGETILVVADGFEYAPIAPDGALVYRVGEIAKLRPLGPGTARAYHADKKALLTEWDGFGWYYEKPYYKDGKRGTDARLTLEDIARSARLSFREASRCVQFLCDAGVMQGWAAGTDPCVRLKPRIVDPETLLKPPEIETELNDAGGGASADPFDF